jgi:septal ring-binding cell division protein DamX
LEFIRRHGLEEQACHLPLADGRHLVFLGLYDWNRDAKAAIQRLPPALRALKPWSRNVSQVHELIKQASP